MAEIVSASQEFVTEGERRAAKILQSLPPHWMVICNKVLPAAQGRSHEIDFIVIGEHWLFALDEKSWRGTLSGNEDQWVRADGASERSPLAKIDYVAKVLAGYLYQRVPMLNHKGQCVHGGVLLSAATELPLIRDSRVPNGLFLLSDVCQRLIALDQQKGNPLFAQFREQIRKALFDLSLRPAIPARIGSYHVENVTTLRPGVRLFDTTFNGDRRHLMVYDLGKNPFEAQELYDFYMQEFKVLRELKTTGLVTEVSDPFRWSDDFLVLPIVPFPEKARPLSTYPLPETRDDLIQELLIASACFKGLETLHTKKLLHRALGPEAISLLQEGPNPKIAFTNFFAARVGTQSIAGTLDKRALAFEDPYAHVNLAYGYGYAHPGTDIFSLALIFLARIAGVPISTIRADVESDLLVPDLQARWPSLPTDVIHELTELSNTIVDTDPQTSPLTAKELATRLADLARRLRTETPSEVGTFILGRNFKIERVLGQGSMARTYLASYADFPDLERYVFKKFHHPEEVLKQGKNEYKTLKDIRDKRKSKYIPDILEIYGPQNDVHIKMEYIAGDTLQSVESTFPWSLDRWWAFAQDLMNAIEVLEDEHLLHRDIKPENIILCEPGNYPVLIDFSFAVKTGASGNVSVAGSPLYLPPEAPNAKIPPVSSDRYAAGIILFKMLTGFLPFKIEAGQRSPRIPEQITDEKVLRLAEVLLQVVANDPGQRFESIAAMRQALQNALLAIPVEPTALQERINPWVESIRGLYRNSESGNADNRGLDTDFVRETYIQTALDKTLLPAIFQHRPKVVFLSGNPGDGKTAFLEQCQQVLREQQAVCHKNDASGWEWHYNQHIFRSCYDASEAHHGQSADEQLTEKLQGLEGATPPATPITVLIAINDGRMADYFENEHVKARFPWLIKQIEHVQHDTPLTERTVWVVDLKQRTFVHFPKTKASSIFSNVLNKLVAPEQWEICDQCASQAICPIRANAQALHEPSVRHRLEYLLLLTHLRRHRHMTMRDLRSVLAYLITANTTCQDVHQAKQNETVGATLINKRYWHSAFAPLEQHDELLTELTSLDPARFSHPHLDRYLHFHQTLADTETRRHLFSDGVDLPLQRFNDEGAWIAAMKRRLYFEVAQTKQIPVDALATLPKVRTRSLLPYHYADLFIELLAHLLDEEDTAWIHEQLALGILRSDGVIEDVPPGMLSVQVAASEEQQLVILKQLPLRDFRLYPQELPVDSIEKIPEVVILEYKTSYPRMEITLDLFELLMRLADGLLPNASEFQPLLEDLKLFKDVLLLQETRDLILIENHAHVHSITQRDGKIVRTAL